MIKGIGLDMIDIDRIRRAVTNNPRFVERILTEKEQLLYHKYTGQRQMEFLAGRFAVKEAYAKANGTGLGAHLSFLDIEVLQLKGGRPILLKPDLADENIFLSITHTEYSVAAQVIIEHKEKR
ncbi:holo-ACP synthase [Listeria sp. PSOL-1]|uniref:holo-ACP synthase n=1 Tax=Listeria sp. PSOL-1 TaxID=1844999 RepID=UPI0013D70C22|nr:holo-ACP synthase [Listeria sp. PSOL-1]